MAYTIVFSAHTARAFRKLTRDIQLRLKPTIDALGHTPRPPGAEKFAGKDDTYRIRVGNYRILYRIEHNKLVVSTIQALMASRALARSARGPIVTSSDGILSSTIARGRRDMA